VYVDYYFYVIGLRAVCVLELLNTLNYAVQLHPLLARIWAAAVFEVVVDSGRPVTATSWMLEVSDSFREVTRDVLQIGDSHLFI